MSKKGSSIMIENYFEKIDTKEKAYWLGFLCADASIKNSNQIQIHLSIKDEEQIDKFCEAINLSQTKKRFYGPYENSGKSVLLTFSSEKMQNDLSKHGCTADKTKTLSFPDLDSEELELAFLIGFFDGDGRESNSELYSSNKRLLSEIKKKFVPTREIKEQQGIFTIYLGANFFKKLLANYPNSMKRKRKTHTEGYLYDKNMDQPNKPYDNDRPKKRKFDPKPDVLEEMVWKMPATKVGEHFGVSGRSIKKRCRKYNIETPGRGYWQKKQANNNKNNDM